jgi:hypothetical protein
MRNMPNLPPNAFVNAAFRCGAGYLGFLADGWKRLRSIGSRYAEEAVVTVARAVVEPDLREQLLPEFLNGLSRYAVEMAMIPASALETAATSLDRREFHQPGSPHAIHMVQGKPVMLPVRFADASQGWAMYAVDAVKAQQALGAYGQTYKVLEVAGQAFITVYGVDFRATDLGPYREVGVEVWVRPKANPFTFPGTLVVKMAVDEMFSVEAANTVWNFGKLMASDMAPIYSPDSVTFTMNRHDPNSLAVTLPCFGRSRTTDVPIRYYSVSHTGGTAWSCVFNRSGEGQGIQYGGNVKLCLGDGTGDHCFCALKNGGGREACLCRRLSDMGLPKTPICNGWTQHMTGQVEAPVAVTR